MAFEIHETPKKEIEQILAAPAKFLEREVKAFEKEEEFIRRKIPLKYAEEYWETLGPGLTTGAADNDPSGIATFSQAGAQYGLQFAWVSILTLPLLAVMQEMCARIGIVSGEGLAANIRRSYKPYTLYSVVGLLFFANTLNVAADLVAMAAAGQLLFPNISAILLVVIFALFSLLLQIFSTYARYAKYLKYLALTLLAYVAVAFMVHLNWVAILQHVFIPSISFSRNSFLILCALLGTTLSPYLFFWQTSQEVEEEVLRGETTIAERKANATKDTIRRMRTDVWSGAILSNIVPVFILIACAGTLFAHGITSINTAAQAAQALKPFGEAAMAFFTLGIISTGLLAIPVLAGSSAYAVAESFHWRHGLYRKLKDAYAFYAVIIVSMLVGVIASVLHLNPILGLIYAAVANGIVAPVVIFFVIRLSTRKHIMKEHTSSRATIFFGWLIFFVMVISGIAALLSFSF